MGVDFATETTLKSLSPALAPLSTETTQTEIRDRIGEISAAPTANTLQDRLKNIKAVLDILNTNTDGIEAILATIRDNADTVEAILSALDIDLGVASDAEATGNGSVIAVLKRLRTLLSGGLPAALIGGRLSVVSPFAYRSDEFTAAGNGQVVDISQSPLKEFGIQVVGTGGAATSWDARLEGSLDGVNFSQVAAHTQLSGNGVVAFASQDSPCRFIRSRVASLVLGTAANIAVHILGMNE